MLPLPAMKNFRLALNVAACDGLPLVVGVGAKETSGSSSGSGEVRSLEEIRSALVPLAFSDSLAGKFHYYATDDPGELAAVKSYRGQRGLFLIAPDAYGLEGEVVSQWTGTAGSRTAAAGAAEPATSANSIAGELLEKAEAWQQASKSHNQHVRHGRQNRIEWESEIPVTDAEALRAQGRK